MSSISIEEQIELIKQNGFSFKTILGDEDPEEKAKNAVIDFRNVYGLSMNYSIEKTGAKGVDYDSRLQEYTISLTWKQQ